MLRSCEECSKKNKMPPCAVKNGMAFPERTRATLHHIKDWFYGGEYEQRGSPHVHMLI